MVRSRTKSVGLTTRFDLYLKKIKRKQYFFNTISTENS